MPYEVKWVCPNRTCDEVCEVQDVNHDVKGNRICPKCGHKEPKK